MSSNGTAKVTQTVTLAGTGAEMPVVGLGTWKMDKGLAAAQVRQAIAEGYRLIDMASDYGNEKEVGEGIRQAIAEGLVTREELFVTSKLWNTFHAPEHVREAAERTLSDAGLEYVDLYLIHFPIALRHVPIAERYPPGWFVDDKEQRYEAVQVPLAETWRAMEQLVDAGLARNIGVSNFSAALLMDLLRSARIRPAVNQVEMHPYLHQRVLIDYCAREGVRMTAYSSFGPISYDQLFETGVQSLLQHPEVARVAKEAGRSPAQVLLRWAVQQGLAIIPKSSSAERLRENADVFSWSLSEDQFKAVSALHTNTRFNNPANYLSPPVPIFD